jgi:RNA polymerase sigma-70 factor (ECF subfamily)
MDQQTCLAERVQASSREVDWEEAYAQLEPRVYNYFRYRVGEDALAEDLTAATFEKAWRGRRRFRRDLGAFSTWLFTIARNTAADHFRRTRREVPLEESVASVDPASPEEVVQYQQELSRLARLLAGLPARERELIALKYGGRLTNRQIARLTRLGESNVGTILNRAVGKLRLEWEGNNGR